ncbi:amidohydrolase family protein [Actinoplanes sp. G11-F43]|uniref:amidohydrolase family protein n=1 Tax=Actinoplanes sp. G11-F43 TaxID=3424130 RepID=UPI003D353853
MSVESSSGVPAICASDSEETAGCCGGASGGCGLSALRRASSGPRPTVTRAEETPLPERSDPAHGKRPGEPPAPASTENGGSGAGIGVAGSGPVSAGPGGTGRVEWLLADSVWWGGRLRTGVALRVAPDGVVKPVPAELAPGGEGTRRFPGTLLPGLVDAHVHSALVDLGTVRAGGIAEVWDLGGVPAAVSDLAQRARLAGGLPKIRYAGPFLIAPGGYPSDRSWAAAGSWREIGSAAEAGAAVAEVWAAGATLIKVTAHTGGPQLAQPVLKALVTSAHAAGLPVVVHAEGAGTVATAFTAGADVLAHTPWTERIDDSLLRACAQRMTWISTLDIHGWGDPDPAAEVAVDNLRRFAGFGGTVRYGTDLGNGPLPPGINAREIRLLQAAGLTPGAVLTAMTEKTGTTLSWISGGLDLTPERFADVLVTARVLDAGVHPST